MLDGSRVRLRAMVTTDAETVLKIYGEGIQTGHATFEAEVPDWHKWDSEHLTQCRWLAEEEDTVLGWGALKQVSPRKVYSRSGGSQHLRFRSSTKSRHRIHPA